MARGIYEENNRNCIGVRKLMKSLKDMPQNELCKAIRIHEFCTPRLLHAIEFATTMHHGQTRKDPVSGREETPYIEHCLRNILRLMRLGCNNEDILVATALHDVVEDCSKEFAPDAPDIPSARELTANHIRNEYGDIAADAVGAVTNPYESRKVRNSKSASVKNNEYRNKVIKIIHENEANYLVKLSDFIDNAGSLHHSPKSKIQNTVRLAKKYHPLVKEFRLAGYSYKENQVSNVGSLAGKLDYDAIDTALMKIELRLSDIVKTELPDQD